jgi:flagellar hook-associated protein 2
MIEVGHITMAINSVSSSSGSAFNFDGIVSGLKTSDIIDKLMSLEKAPLNQLTAQQSTVQKRDSAYAEIKTQVGTFQSALKTLLLSSNVNTKSTSSTLTSVATATAGSDATNATYQLSVSRLATASTISSSVWNGSAWASAPIGAGLDSAVALNNAHFGTAPTAGTFTINGTQVTITDPTTQTLDQIVALINTNVPTVQASVTTDASGNKNAITLHALDGNAIQLGSGSDSSNFLSAAHLVSTGAVGDLVSTMPLGPSSMTASLASGHLGGALAGSGSFTVNGKTISWDATQDSLNSVINKINSSAAGVNVTYDPTRDALKISNIATGGQTVDLGNDVGGFLSAMHLMGGTVGGVSQQTLGVTARFSLNGGPDQFSNSNNVSGVVQGVTFRLAGTGATTVSVTQDTSTAIKNAQDFATQFNALIDLIDKDTQYDATKNKASVLTGDAGIRELESQIRGFLTSAATNVQGTYTSLASVGISTGAFGSAVGTTDHLVVDTAKLTAALQADPSAVARLLGGDPTVTVNPDAMGMARPGHWISSISGSPASGTAGRYAITLDSSGNLTSVFTPGGSLPLAAVSGTMAVPPGTNTSLISGLTLNTAALPASGSLTDTVWFGQPGVLGRLNDYLTTALGAQGVFQGEKDSANKDLQSISKQIDDTNARLTARQQALQAQFTAMEVALSTLNSQGVQLMSSLGQSNNKQ